MQSNLLISYSFLLVSLILWQFILDTGKFHKNLPSGSWVLFPGSIMKIHLYFDTQTFFIMPPPLDECKLHFVFLINNNVAVINNKMRTMINDTTYQNMSFRFHFTTYNYSAKKGSETLHKLPDFGQTKTQGSATAQTLNLTARWALLYFPVWHVNLIHISNTSFLPCNTSVHLILNMSKYAPLFSTALIDDCMFLDAVMNLYLLCHWNACTVFIINFSNVIMSGLHSVTTMTNISPCPRLLP